MSARLPAVPPMLRAVAAGLCLAVIAAPEAQGFLGWNSKKKQAAEEAVLKAGEKVRDADETWKAGDGDGAIKLYRDAIAALREIEDAQYDIDTAPIRFRRAYCETQIDQIKFTLASRNERRVTVTNPGPAPAAPEPAAPSGTVAAVSAPLAPLPATNAPLVHLDVAGEIAWAREMTDAGRLDEAAAALIRVLKSAPQQRSARLMLATVRCRQKAYADALIILEDLRGDREDEPVLLALAGAYCGATRYYEAMLALDRLLAANPRHADAHVNMAYLLLEMSPGRQKDSELYYRQAVKLGAARDAALERRLGF